MPLACLRMCDHKPLLPTVKIVSNDKIVWDPKLCKPYLRQRGLEGSSRLLCYLDMDGETHQRNPNDKTERPKC